MGAINDIVFEGVCPACGAQGELRAQAHIGGDKTGRFCHRVYRLDEEWRGTVQMIPGIRTGETWTFTDLGSDGSAPRRTKPLSAAHSGALGVSGRTN